MTKFFLFMTYFLSSFSFAQENEYFQACFTDKSIARMAIKEIKFIKNKTDKIKLDGKCIDFYIAKIRAPVYTKFIQVKFLGLYELSSLHSSQAKQCKLELTTIKKSNLNKTKLGFSKNVNLEAKNDHSNITTSININISQGTTGSMIVDSEKLSIKCRVTSAGYNLEIETSSPLLSLSTSRFINYGQSIDLGSFVQDIYNKKKELFISKGIQYKKEFGTKYSSIILKAK